MSAPGTTHSRTSSRLLGQNPEFGPLRVNPPMYPSRSVSRQSMRTETEEPEAEELSEREQDHFSEAEDELDPPDTEATAISKTLGLLFGIVCIMNMRFANWHFMSLHSIICIVNS